MTNNLAPIPDRPAVSADTPGRLLKKYVDTLPGTVAEKAARLGLSRPGLYATISNEIPISPTLAIKLEVLFELSAEQWLQAQNNYDLELTREKADVQTAVEALKAFRAELDESDWAP